MENNLDQFYTKTEVALSLTKKLNAYNLANYTFLEPSAGTGSFINALNFIFKEPKIIAVDIEPKSSCIIKKDFLEFETKHKNIFTIGNPPFGKRASLAIKFFNHASNFSNYIAFILPLQFQKWSVQKHLNKDFKLILDETLEPNSFIFNGKEYSVRCCFQIWTKLESKIDLRIKEAPPTKHKDFEMWQYNNTKETRKYFDKSKYKWDFAVARQGYYNYKNFIYDENKLNPKVQYIFFKANNNNTLEKLKNIDFEKLSKKNTTIPGFGKADVVKEFLSININKNEI